MEQLCLFRSRTTRAQIRVAHRRDGGSVLEFHMRTDVTRLQRPFNQCGLGQYLEIRRAKIIDPFRTTAFGRFGRSMQEVWQGARKLKSQKTQEDFKRSRWRAVCDPGYKDGNKAFDRHDVEIATCSCYALRFLPFSFGAADPWADLIPASRR